MEAAGAGPGHYSTTDSLQNLGLCSCIESPFSVAMFNFYMFCAVEPCPSAQLILKRCTLHVDSTGLPNRTLLHGTCMRYVLAGASQCRGLSIPGPLIMQVSSAYPHIGIGDGSVLRRAIVDKNARVGRNVKVRGLCLAQSRERTHGYYCC
jgi:hypothetical protein